ncbi:MAG: enolase C-terminal domain-like protein [Bacillota bacterium]
MRIARVDVITASIPVVRPFRISLGMVDRKDQVFIRLMDDEGHEGWGECSPSPLWPRGLTQSAVRDILIERVVPCLVDRDPNDIGVIMADIARVAADTPFVWAPVDIALHDLVARSRGLPVYALLGGLAHRRIPLHWTIGITSPDVAEKEAAEAKAAGFTAFKVKVGGADFRAELDTVRAIRSAVGEDVVIAVDANQGWTTDTAPARIRALERFDLELVEQPVPWWDVRGLARVRQAVGTPIMADESCFSPRDAMELVRLEAADVLNIKLMKCGGLWNARKIAAIAEAAGLACFVGGMTDLDVAVAAALHFFAAHSVVRYSTGILRPQSARRAQPVVKNPWQTGPGYFQIPDGPGLGVEVDSETLEHLGGKTWTAEA